MKPPASSTASTNILPHFSLTQLHSFKKSKSQPRESSDQSNNYYYKTLIKHFHHDHPPYSKKDLNRTVSLQLSFGDEGILEDYPAYETPLREYHKHKSKQGPRMKNIEEVTKFVESIIKKKYTPKNSSRSGPRIAHLGQAIYKRQQATPTNPLAQLTLSPQNKASTNIGKPQPTALASTGETDWKNSVLKSIKDEGLKNKIQDLNSFMFSNKNHTTKKDCRSSFAPRNHAASKIYRLFQQNLLPIIPENTCLPKSEFRYINEGKYSLSLCAGLPSKTTLHAKADRSINSTQSRQSQQREPPNNKKQKLNQYRRTLNKIHDECLKYLQDFNKLKPETPVVSSVPRTRDPRTSSFQRKSSRINWNEVLLKNISSEYEKTVKLVGQSCSS